MRSPARLGTRLALLLLVLTASCGLQGQVRVGGRVESRRVRGGYQNALERAHRDLRCGYDDMIVERHGHGNLYSVEGCGSAITYLCVRMVCTHARWSHRREEVGAARRPGPPPSTWSDEQVRQLQGSIHAAVLQCLPDGTESIRLQLAISPEGQVRRVRSPHDDPAVATCVDAALADGRMGGTVAAARTVVIDFSRSIAAPQTLGAAPEEPPGVPGITPTTEGAVRTAIDARTPALLACVEADALSMQVSWTREGRLDALLRGDRQGTPEEGCVRAIVQQLSIPTPGAPGTIVHAIQR